MPSKRATLVVALFVAALALAPSTTARSAELSSAPPARTAGANCGTIRTANTGRLRVRIRHGRTICHTARWILGWWFSRAARGQYHRGWYCFNDHGADVEDGGSHPLYHGGIGHCSKTVGRRYATVGAYVLR